MWRCGHQKQACAMVLLGDKSLQGSVFSRTIANERLCSSLPASLQTPSPSAHRANNGGNERVSNSRDRLLTTAHSRAARHGFCLVSGMGHYQAGREQPHRPVEAAIPSRGLPRGGRCHDSMAGHPRLARACLLSDSSGAADR